MNLVKIKSIIEGMVTAAEVKDRMGRTLMEKGKAIVSEFYNLCLSRKVKFMNDNT